MTPDGEFREAVRRLHRAKDAAYRDAWKRRGEVISIVASIARKVDRLGYGLDGAPATAGESWPDTAADLLVDCLRYQAYLADLDQGTAARLFGGSGVRPPYGDGPAGFEALLSRADLGVCRGGRPAGCRGGPVRGLPVRGAGSLLPGRVQYPAGTCAARPRPGAHRCRCRACRRAEVRACARARGVHQLVHGDGGRRMLMRDEDYAKLLEDTEHELLAGRGPAGVLGLTPVTLRLLASLAACGLARAVEAVYTPAADDPRPPLTAPVRPFEALREATCGVLVVAADVEKEDFLCAALPFISGAPKVVVAGYGHLGFRDAVFEEERAQLLVPSLANGYPNSLVHLYQCLVNAARLGLSGVVAEFGMFKGGTTMFLSRVIERLGASLAGDRVRHLRRVPAAPLPAGHVRPPRLRLHRPGRRPALS